jgi:H+/gluconate symporter-like permease
MVTGLPLLLVFLLAIALLLTLLIRFKANPFPALLAVSLLTAA